ncbi:hemagglutinin repeat-containing protein [Agrobacterium sp. S2]|nr:hemagglutinin repeat-containing protein [Agrobacterium sp. S2]
MKNFAYRHYFSSAARALHMETRRTIRFDPAVLARKGVATLLSGLLVFQPMLVQAQVAPDINAPVGNQPGVGTAPNGVPLVDIVTPNGQGLSHNKYHDFNVGNPGLILNNHNGELGTSRLGGVTPGNPNLKSSGPASVILNEVTSGNRSALQGATEVFGGRADVIIANPNGITCDGCGFINTPRATLTTGTPDIDGTGRLSGFTVQGGDVTFGSKGGNFASGDGAVDLFDIVSRRVQIDGPVNGKHLRLSAGRQKFNYATGEATALDGADDAGKFAIDGSALGAMQADRIKIVVTDKGAGVRMRGDMAAHAGELTLSADGKISLGNASGRDGVSIQSKSRQVEAKKVTSKKRVVVKAAKGITLEAVAADEDVILNSDAGLLSIAGDAASLGNIELTSSGAIVTGNVAAGQNASLRAEQGITAGQINADGAASLTTTSGNIALSGTAKAGGGALNIIATSGSISAASLVSFNNMALTAGTDIATGDILSGGALVASARSLKAGNVVSGVDFAATNAANGAIQIGSSGDMRLRTIGGIDIASLLSAGSLSVSAAALAAQNVTSNGIITIAGDTNVSGQLLGSGDVSITGANIKAGAIISGVDFAASKASPNGAIVVGNSGDTTLLAQAGTIDIGTLLSAGNLLGDTATFKAINVTSHGTTKISGAAAIGGQLLSGSDITINGASIDLGTAVAGVDLAALANGNVVLGNTAHALNLTATAGNLNAQRLLSSGDAIASATGNLSANATAHGDLNLTAGGTLTLSGQSLAGGNATLNAGSINLGTLVSGVDFAATEQSGGALILKTGVPGTGKMVLNASNGSITADQLLSGGDLKAKAQQNVSYNSLQSFAAADLNAVLGAISLDKNTVAKGDIALTLQSLDLSNNRSKLATAGTLIVNAASANLANSTLTFGGIALNLSSDVDASGTKLRAVTADGGSGNITIAATTITTTAATALLAANDLTLTLASLTNAAQLAANNNLTFNISGSFTNTATGLVYAGQDGRLYIAGDLLNDQGAILVGHDLTIAANAAGARNSSITNVSGLIQAGRDAVITTANLTNRRISTPTWSTSDVSSGVISGFELNPYVRDKPFAYLETEDQNAYQLYPGVNPPLWSEYEPLLWSQAVLGDGSSYRAWTWTSENGPTEVGPIYRWILNRVPKGPDGKPIIDPNNPSKYFIVDHVLHGGAADLSTAYTWDETSNISQTVREQRFDKALDPEAMIRSGRNLSIDATTLNNSYSSIEADGNATLKGSVLNNQGVTLTRTTTTTCNAQGTCSYYDANGNHIASKDIAQGTSIISNVEAIASAAGNIKAVGNLDISGFATVNNTSAEGSIAGGAALSTAPTTNDPTAGLNGLTAGAALYTPNAALGGLSANGTPLTGAELIAALGTSAPKPNSGGFGGTIPGQVFLYETRAEFLDVGKFYGSGYFINRIGYNPDRSIPFLGDAYFENQLIDQQLRQLVNQGLGKGSFIPGSDAIEQMKTLLDRGADYAAANGLTIGEKLSPEMIANLTETMVWYEKKTVNGIEVLVPTVYVANADKANLTVAGALISGGTLDINVGEVNNSGAIAAKTDLKLAATNITATGGSFIAGNDLSLSASQNITLTAQTTNVGGETVVNPNAMVSAGGDANLAAAETLKLQGAGVDVGGNASLSGRDVVLDAQKVANDGSQNATGTRINAGGDIGIKAENDVTIIGSSAKAGGALDVTAENGSVNVVTTDVTRKSDDGYLKSTRTTQQGSELSSGGDTSISASQDVLISGSAVNSGGDTSIGAGGNVNITAAQNQTDTTFGKNKLAATTHTGSDINADGSVTVTAGSANGNINVIGSNVAAGDKASLQAGGDVTIAAATDSLTVDLQGTSKSGSFLNKKTQHVTGHRDSQTAVGSSVSGEGGVDIKSGGDTVISASKVQAGTEDRKADLNIDAGGDLIVSSGKDTVEGHDRQSSKGFLSKGSGKYDAYNETTVASELGASGNVKLNAGDNVAISGSKVTAGENIAIEGDSVSIIGAQEAHDMETSQKKSGLGAGSGGGFYSIWGKEEKSSKENIVANVGSELSAGNNVSIKARETDVNIVGSKVEAGNDIALDAARDVNILPGAESYASEDKEKRSGFGIQLKSSEGSASIGIGFGSSKDETRQGAETNARSSLSAGNNVTINAGRDANLQAATVEADNDVAITAERDVNLLAAQDKTNYEHMHEELFAGITATVSTGLVSSAKSIADAAGKVANVSDGYSAANAGFAGLKAYDAINNLSSMVMPDANGNYGNIASASIGVGFEYSKSKENAESSIPVVTGIRGGNSVSIEAKSGDINSHGAQIVAGYDENGLLSGGAGDISLKAGNDINLESAQATNSSSSSSKSAGASIGYSVGVGLGGATGGWTGSAHAGSGKSNSNGTTQVNTHVTGAGNITIESGRDTNLKGAVVEGETITANVGRDLNIISVPDTGESSNKSSSIGVSGSLTGGVPKVTSVSPGYGTGSGETNWISEQSGLVSKGEMDVRVEGNTHLGAGKIISESGDLTLDTGTLTHEDFSGSKKYEGFDIQANIDLTLKDADGNKQQQPDQTSQPKNSAEGTYQLDDTRQEVRATVGPGEIIIRDKDKQAELEASGQTEDLAALNRDPDKAYEITKDKHVEIEYYLSDTSVKAALEAGKSTVEIVIDALGRMVNDGKLTPQDYDTARRLAKYKDDPNVIAQLDACGQRQGFNQFNPLDWLITPAHAQAPCMISTAEGTFPISAIGAATCRATFAAMTSTAGLIGAAAGVILLASTSSAGGGKIDETHNLDDGTVVRLQGNGSDLKRSATLSMPDGTKSVLDFTLDPTTGALILTGGTLNGKPMARASLQNVIYSMQSGGVKNVVLSEGAGGSGSSNSSASAGGAGAAAGAPDPDDDKKPQRKLSREEERAIRSYEKRIAEHEAKLMEFKNNPTVRPGMENQPQHIIEQQQAARIKHLETEIRTFKNNISKIRQGPGK